jgi:ribosome-interacting GTPase 1
MPTNLPPEYREVERRFRAAESIGEKIACLEELISTVPKHKGTDHLRADLRRKLSKLKSEAKTQKGAAKRDSAYRIPREGAGQVVVLGPPNVGKSALVAALTNATPEVADYPFTTWSPTPGMMPIEDIQVQLVDTPPLNRDYVEPALLDLIRRADMILLVVDLQTDPHGQLEEAIAILEEHRIVPQRLKSAYANTGRVFFKPLLVLANKADDEGSDELFEVFRLLLEEEWPAVPVSTTTRRNFDQLKRVVFERLRVMRIYSKPPGRDADLTKPYVMKRGSTLEEFARSVHLDFYENLAAARVWGSTDFEGQLVPRDHVLQDGDVVELRI